MTRDVRNSLLSLALLALASSSTSRCAADPSAREATTTRETVAFIVNLTDLGDERIEFDSSNPCRIAVTALEPFHGPCVKFRTYRFSFGDLNPDSVRLSTSQSSKYANLVHLRTTNARKAIQLDQLCRTATQTIDSSTSHQANLELLTKEEGDAEKVQRAVVHVINQCGGKQDLF